MICLWDIGNPAPPTYENAQHSNLLKLQYKFNFEEKSLRGLYTMAWVGDAGTGWILVGTSDGLTGWKISSDNIKKDEFPKTRPSKVELR